ncbi:MAG TPA: DUF5808 domain-containing protein [Kineosporiaceae bacterium]|nr:DUF5808 domain-containing protein [Kineosporiaceae bacterium]
MSREKRQAKQPGLGGLLRLIGLGFLIAAVVKELRTPAPERTWNGTLGFVPYDLRRPTAQRFRDRMWAPEDGHLFTPQPFGVGWTLNLGRLVALLRQRLASRA